MLLLQNYMPAEMQLAASLLMPHPTAATLIKLCLVQRNADGSFAGYESTPPFELHDGWLSLHFRTNNYR